MLDRKEEMKERKETVNKGKNIKEARKEAWMGERKKEGKDASKMYQMETRKEGEIRKEEDLHEWRRERRESRWKRSR